ncbi:hypothetical protein MBLNU230_g7367t2 [Neophaeotheca triangularis]
MPSIDPSLPAPKGSLYQVVIGRGTQNYTCDKSNDTAVPAPIGADALLFNASCIAASMPDLLAALPDIALRLPSPSSKSASPSILDSFLVGHHYFVDNTTPIFNLTTEHHSYGMGTFKKVDDSPAPEGAMAGVRGQKNGAAAWLYLEAKTTDVAPDQEIMEVYRVNTAGGKPPKDCSNSPETFEIQYATEYWFYR